MKLTSWRWIKWIRDGIGRLGALGREKERERKREREREEEEEEEEEAGRRRDQGLRVERAESACGNWDDFVNLRFSFSSFLKTKHEGYWLYKWEPGVSSFFFPPPEKNLPPNEKWRMTAPLRCHVENAKIVVVLIGRAHVRRNLRCPQEANHPVRATTFMSRGSCEKKEQSPSVWT